MCGRFVLISDLSVIARNFDVVNVSIGLKLINARAETVAQKPSFKNALQKRRCLIPADGFYEWKKEGNKKISCCFGLKGDSPFGFAGLYETWIAADKKQVDTCTIITTQANGAG